MCGTFQNWHNSACMLLTFIYPNHVLTDAFSIRVTILRNTLKIAKLNRKFLRYFLYLLLFSHSKKERAGVKQTGNILTEWASVRMSGTLSCQRALYSTHFDGTVEKCFWQIVISLFRPCRKDTKMLKKKKYRVYFWAMIIFQNKKVMLWLLRMHKLYYISKKSFVFSA